MIDSTEFPSALGFSGKAAFQLWDFTSLPPLSRYWHDTLVDLILYGIGLPRRADTARSKCLFAQIVGRD